MRKQRLPGNVTMGPAHAAEGDLACLVAGRALPGEDFGWGLRLGPFAGDRRDLAIRLRRAGTVEVGTFSFDQGTFELTEGPIRSPALHSGDGFNTLLVILRGGQRLEIYVNGSAICPPIQLAQRLAPSVVPNLVSWSRHAEFTRFRLWLLPPPAPASGPAEGKRAPDLREVVPLVDDQFNPTRSRFPRDRYDRPGKPGYERFFEKQLYVTRNFGKFAPENWGHLANVWHLPLNAVTGDLACQVEGRVLTERDAGWAVGFCTPKRDRDVAVRLRRDGAVEVGNFFWDHGAATRVGPFRHTAIRSGDRFNTLLVVLRGGQRLEVYVNGSAVCPPIQLEHPITPVHPGIQLWERSGHPEKKGRAEFRRFTVWQLPR
jgi:hypothetical protein